MKRVLSLIMVLAMVLAMVPAVFAADTAVVSSGTATADADSKWTFMYTPAVDGVLTVTVGDGNAAWASDIMDFSDFSNTEDVTGTAEGSYTHAVTGGVKYSVRIFGQGDPSTAISNIPYSISFAASETEDLGEAIKTGTASCYEETFTGEGKTWTEFLPEEIKITAPANGTVVVNLQAPTNVAAATEPMWSCEAVGTKFPERQATDGTYRFDVYSGQEYTIAIGAYDAYEDESTAPKYISGNVAYEIYFVAGEVELKDYVVNNHYPLDVEVDDAMVLDYVTSGKEERNYTPNSVFSGESVVNVSEKVTVEADPTAKVTITPFEPAMDANGTYKFTAPEGVTLSYWGTQSALPVLQEKDSTLADNVIYATVDNGIWNLCKPVTDMMGTVSEDENDWYWLWSSSQMLIGVEGASGEVTLNIEKTDALESLEADTSGEDTPNYSIKHGFANGFYNLADDAVLEAVNLEEDHTAVKGEDGYYHLDTVDGPIVYVDTETSYISLSSLVSAMALNVTYVNDNGEEVKENFRSAMSTYADKLAATDGVYPLTRDLEIFLSNYGWQTDLEALPYDPETADANTALMSVCRIVAGSAGEEEKTELAIGQNEIAVPAAGVTYTWIAEKAGTFTLNVDSFVAAGGYEIIVYKNGTEVAFLEPSEVAAVSEEADVTVEVAAGDVITVEAKTLDADYEYADGTVNMTAAFAATPVFVEKDIVFNLGANGEAAHVDGDACTEYTETVGDYTLTLTDLAKVFGPAYDATGNSCIKLGTSKVVGGFSFTVPENVNKVIIAVAKYKANTTTIDVNGTQYSITTASNNGEYTDIEVDTSATKTVTLTTVTGGVRAMVNTITYVAQEEDTGCKHANVTTTTVEASCTVGGSVTVTCDDCGETISTEATAATGHSYDEGTVTTEPTCTSNGVLTKTCANGCGIPETEVVYGGHDYVDGVCSVCKAVEYVMVTAPEVGVAYKWGVEQTKLEMDLYYNATKDSYYGGTTNIIEDSVDVYLEATETEGAYYLYSLDADGNKVYFNASVSGKFVNVYIGGTASTAYTYNTEYNTLVATLTVQDVEGDYYVGSYSSYDDLRFSTLNYAATSFPAHFYAAPAAEEEPDENENTFSIETYGNIDWTAPASGTVTFTGDGAFMILDGSSTMMDMPAETATIDVVEGKVYTFYNEQYGQVVNVTYAYAPAEEEPEVITGSVSVESFGNIDWTAPESGTVTFTADGSFMIMKVWDYMMDSPAATATLNVVKGETYTIYNEQYGVNINVTYTYGESGEIEPTLPAGIFSVESYSSGTRWIAPAAGNVTFTADGAFVLLDSANNLVAEMVTTATTDVNEGDELYFIEPNGVGLTVNYAYNSVEGGSGDAEIVYKDLSIGYNSIAQQDVNYKYTATEAGMLTLSLAAQSVNGTVSAQYSVNGENVQTLAEGGYAELNLVSGNVVTINVTATGYNTLVAAWYPTVEEPIELVLGDNEVEAPAGLAGGSWIYTPAADGELTVTVAALSYSDDEGATWTEVPADYFANQFGRGQFTLSINGENAYAPTATVNVTADTDVTVSLSSMTGNPIKATINLAVAAGGDEPTEPDGSADAPFIIEALPYTEEITLTEENYSDGLYYQYTVPADMNQIQIDYAEGFISYIVDNYDYVEDSNGNRIYPVEPGSTIVINTWGFAAGAYTFKVAEWEAPSEPDGSQFAPYIIESLPTTFTVELNGQADVYYKHTATEAGAIAAESDGAQVGIMVNGDYAYGNPITYAAGDVLTFNVGSWWEGTYEVKLYDPTVAKIGDVAYTDLSVALEAAQAGETVTLVADTKVGYAVITPGVTLDLGAHTLTADYVIGLTGSSITAATYSTSKAFGVLNVAADNISVSATAAKNAAGNAVIPVWNGEEFVFAQVVITTKSDVCGLVVNEEKDQIGITLAVNATSAVKSALLSNGTSDNEISVVLRADWVTEDAALAQEFVYNDTYAGNAFANNQSLIATLTGYSAMDELQISAMIVTDNGIVVSVPFEMPE